MGQTLAWRTKWHNCQFCIDPLEAEIFQLAAHKHKRLPTSVSHLLWCGARLIWWAFSSCSEWSREDQHLSRNQTTVPAWKSDREQSWNVCPSPPLDRAQEWEVLNTGHGWNDAEWTTCSPGNQLSNRDCAQRRTMLESTKNKGKQNTDSHCKINLSIILCKTHHRSRNMVLLNFKCNKHLGHRNNIT